MADNPWAPSEYYTTAFPHWRVMSDVVDGGTARLREAAETYLPRYPMEETENYRRRVDTAVLYNATRRTVEGAASMLLRKPPTFEGAANDPVMADLDDIDMNGTRVGVWLRQWARAALRDGITYAIVDATRKPEGVEEVSREDVRDMGLRPYWVAIPAMSMIDIVAGEVGGKMHILQVRYTERTNKRDGRYGTESVERLRVLTLPHDVDAVGNITLLGGGVTFEVFERAGAGADAAGAGRMIESGVMDIDFIPLVAFYTNRTGFMRGWPPYLDLAHQNIRHFQAQSASDRGIDVGQYAILAVKGLQTDAPMQIGPFSAIRLDGENGDAKWVEIAGSALEAAQERLKDSERIMAIEGLSSLHSESRQAETARAKEIDKAEQNANFEAMASDLQDAVNNLLWYHALWYGRSDHPVCDVNKDFDTLALNPEHVRELRELRAAGDISREAILDALKRGEWLPDTYDPEEDLRRVMEESGAALEATTSELFGDE